MMSDDNQTSIKRTVKGRLAVKTFARTTKSESIGVYLETAEERFLIRPAGNNPLTDNPLAALAGKYIEATGTMGIYVFFADKWHEIPENQAG